MPLTPFIMSKANIKVLTKSGSYNTSRFAASDSFLYSLLSLISIIYRTAINYCFLYLINAMTDEIIPAICAKIAVEPSIAW